MSEPRWTPAQRAAIDDRGGALLVSAAAGSGKTAVAAGAVWLAARSGWQSALMAPTEILAQQHYQGLAPLLENLGIRCALLTGSTTAKTKRSITQQLESGEIDFAIGTHALITGSVAYRDLGLVVTDEQHRFGVGQRNALIAGIRCAGVGFIHQCNAVVAGGKGAADGKGVVGGAIVQQQDLNAFISLGANAFDTAGNAPGSVVHGHDDAYKGKFHRFSFSQMRLWVRANASESFCTGPLGRGLSNRLR